MKVNRPFFITITDDETNTILVHGINWESVGK